MNNLMLRLSWCMWGLGIFLFSCARPWTPDSITVTGIGADPRGIPQPHVAVSVTYYLHPTLIQMANPTTTTTLVQ